MIQHEQEFYRTLELYGINHNDVCIIGSSVIARAGFRNNNDIDITLRPSAREALIKSHSDLNVNSTLQLINLSENIQVCRERYGVIGIKDYDLFSDDDNYSEDYNGIRIAKFELEIAKKLRRLEPKDQKDLVEIGRASRINNYDWEKIFYLAYFNGEKICVNPVNNKAGLLRRIARRVKRIINKILPVSSCTH
ncbi:MAG: hypothetical protein IJP48_08630 [Synergistaceae bacterium]|nr:hypothetical protein [Synergistaceae bacterium]